MSKQASLFRVATSAAQSLRTLQQRALATTTPTTPKEKINATAMVFAGFRLPHSGLMMALEKSSQNFRNVVMVYPQTVVDGYSPFSIEQRKVMLEIAAQEAKIDNLNIAGIPVEVWHELQQDRRCQYALNWITHHLENEGFKKPTIVRCLNKGSREHPLYEKAESLLSIYVVRELVTFKKSPEEARGSKAAREVSSSAVLANLFNNNQKERELARSAISGKVFNFIELIAQIAYIVDQSRTDFLPFRVGDVTADHYKKHAQQAERDLAALKEAKELEIAICHNGEANHLPIKRENMENLFSDGKVTLLQLAAFNPMHNLGSGTIDTRSDFPVYDVDRFGNRKLKSASELITFTPIGPIASRYKSPRPVEKIGIVVNQFSNQDACKKMIDDMLQENDVVVVAIDKEHKDISHIESLFKKEIGKGKIKIIDLGEKVSAANLKEALQQNFATIAPENIKFYSYAAKDKNAIAANMVESGFAVSVSRADPVTTLSQPKSSTTTPEAERLALAVHQNLK